MADGDARALDDVADNLAAFRVVGAYGFLILFVLAAFVGGTLLGVGVGLGWGFVALSAASGASAVLLGSE